MDAGTMASQQHNPEQGGLSIGESADSPQSPGRSSNAGSPANRKSGHKRIYQACEHCRRGKVKCDMGDVNAPHPPPCKRCRREFRDCVVADKRRKESGKRARSETVGANNNTRDTKRPKRDPDGRNASYNGGHHTPSPDLVDAESYTAATGNLKGETFDGHQAFDSLIKAAYILAPAGRQRNALHTSQPKVGGLSGQAATDGDRPQFSLESKREAARKHWSRFKYVRSGLMTAWEAMDYVDYFYDNCMPFTPIAIPDYRDPALHQLLLEREPFLIMAIMTIASRFMELNKDSVTGTISRPQNTHSVIFHDTQKILNGIIYAQEQFGGGLTGGGKFRAKNSDPLHRYGLRSITTVEALLLLCEWAPRALHFPPSDDIELMIPLNPLEDEQDNDNESYPMLNGDGQKRRESWLEPAWRCDTMIWMLLHNAKALALEIGLFEDRTESELLQSTNGVPADEIHAYHVRKMKTRAVFWAFYVQTCGRLELIGKVPANYLESFNYGVADMRVRDAVKQRALMHDGKAYEPYQPMVRTSSYGLSKEEAVWFFWQEITAIMKSGNQNMFPRKERTRELTRTGEYRKWIEIYAPLLQEWRDEFDKCDLVPEPMKTILLIEYEYVRIYIHSLSLQAFVERAVASTPSKQNIDTFAPHGAARNDSVTNDNQGIAPDDVRKWMQKDGPYIQTLVESCQHVLALVGESNIPPDKLKHFTVRVYFRIMASAVHLLKDYAIAVHDYGILADPMSQSFVVGAYADNIARSFELLGKATDVLLHRIVDDVHIGRTFAEMITTVSAQIHKRLTRFQPATGSYRSRAVSATPVTMHSPPHGINGNHPAPVQPDFTNGFGGSGTLTPNMGMDPFSIWSNNPGGTIDELDAYDPSKTVMPPPHLYAGNGDLADDGMGNSIANGVMDPWIGLNLNPLMNMTMNGENPGVSHGHFGPTFDGGGDMLDPYMLGMNWLNDQNGHALPIVSQNGQRW